MKTFILRIKGYDRDYVFVNCPHALLKMIKDKGEIRIKSMQACSDDKKEYFEV